MENHVRVKHSDRTIPMGSIRPTRETTAQKEKVPKTVQPSQPGLKHSGKSRQPTHAPCPSFRHQKQVHGDIKSFNPFPAKIVDLKEGIFMVWQDPTPVATIPYTSREKLAPWLRHNISFANGQPVRRLPTHMREETLLPTHVHT